MSTKTQTESELYIQALKAHTWEKMTLEQYEGWIDTLQIDDKPISSNTCEVLDIRQNGLNLTRASLIETWHNDKSTVEVKENIDENAIVVFYMQRISETDEAHNRIESKHIIRVV